MPGISMAVVAVCSTQVMPCVIDLPTAADHSDHPSTLPEGGQLICDTTSKERSEPPERFHVEIVLGDIQFVVVVSRPSV